MESVDKLREWSRRYDGHWIDHKTGEMIAIYGECRPSGTNERFSVNEGERLRELLDEIEREHEREVTMAHGEAVAELGNKVARERVKLPVDADGKPIRIGDKLDGYGQTTVVKWLTLGDDGWSMTCENGLWFDFAAFTHHHEPTVETTLQEMLEKAVGYSDAHTTVALNAIAKYAAKLRLADDCEEQ